MQGKAEPNIAQSYFVQVTPQRYTQSDNTFEFNYNTNQRIFANTVSMTNFSIYNQFPNISQFYNSFQINVAGQVYQIRIPQNKWNNFWDITTLHSIIETQLVNDYPAGNWIVQFGGNDQRSTQIVSAVPFTLVYTPDATLQQVLRYLGFSSFNDPAFSIPALVQTSQYPYAVQVTQNLNVQIKNAGNMMSDTISVIAQVPLNSAIGTGLFFVAPYYQYARHIISDKIPVPISNFQIAILDDNGNPMILQGQRLSMTLLFESFKIGV